MNTSTKQYGLVPVGEGYSRSFWTKRKRSTTSMLAVIGLIVGIAVAYKLYEKEIPNNVVRDASAFDFTVAKTDPAWESPSNPASPSAATNVYVPASGANPVFRTDPYPAGPNLYPGDFRETGVRVRNTNLLPARDAVFQVYVDDITVADTWDEVNDVPLGTPVVIASSDPKWAYFVNLFTLRITGGPAVCTGGLQAINASAPCNKGVIQAAGKSGDVKYYTYRMTEAEDNTDQSFYKGWQVQFTLIFQAKLAAL